VATKQFTLFSYYALIMASGVVGPKAPSSVVAPSAMATGSPVSAIQQEAPAMPVVPLPSIEVVVLVEMSPQVELENVVEAKANIGSG
jgi:hypothetical protein